RRDAVALSCLGVADFLSTARSTAILSRWLPPPFRARGRDRRSSLVALGSCSAAGIAGALGKIQSALLRRAGPRLDSDQRRPALAARCANRPNDSRRWNEFAAMASAAAGSQ